MNFSGMEQGRSAKYLMLTDENGYRYSMFVKDLLTIVQGTVNIVEGKLSGTWTFAKRGTNYGIKFVK